MRFLNRFLLLCGAGILAALIGGHLNAFHPALDSLSHFRLHFAAIGAVLALILAVLRNPLGAAALGVISVLSFALTIWPAVSSQNAQAASDPAPVYRLVQANLRFDNRTPEEFLRLIARQTPDVITLQEVSDQWLPKLAVVSAAWPHQKICPGTNRVGGVAILSRRPFGQGGISLCGNSGALAVQAIDFNGKQVTVASLHLKWPWPHRQPEQLIDMAKAFGEIKSTGQPILVGGDMNAAPWSAAVDTIAEATGTRILPQARGTWLLPLFPESWTPFIGLPIDNILLSGQVALKQAISGPNFGSDHRPLMIEFTIDDERANNELSNRT